MTLSNGDVFEGPFMAGVLHGEGTINYANGDVFRGTFVQGVRSGKGEFRAKHLRYEGAWANDNAHGTGKLVAGQCVYQGTFNDGAFVQGEYTAPSGDVFSGSFHCMNLLDGQGLAKYKDGSVYKGNWRRGLKEGEGKLEWPDGSSITGTFKADLANGPGQWAGGPKQWLKEYTGPFVDGRPHGKQGEATFADQSRFVGSFKEGLPDKGDWICPPDSQTVASGKWNGYRLAQKASLRVKDEAVDGTPDGINRVVVKGRYLPPSLPASRPSFPMNVSQGKIQ